MLPLARSSSWTVILLAVCCAGLQAQNIVPSAAELLFTAPVDGFGQPATLTVTSSGSPIVINATANTFGVGHWLSVSPSVSGTPANLVVTVSAVGLTAGLYQGEVLLSSAAAPNSPVAVPVRLTVGGGGTGAISVTPASLTFSGQPTGAAPAPATLAIASTPSGLGFATSASTTSGGSWLAVTPLTGTAPDAITVSVVPAGLPPGEYTGTVLITPATGEAVSVPVTLNITTGNVLSVSASAMQFYYQIGNFFPASQSFTVSNRSTAPVNFGIIPSTNDTRNWLSATPLFGNTPQAVTVTVNASGLLPGTYTGKINVSAPTAANSSIDVPVTLTVSNSPLLTVGSFPARFTHQSGMTPPPAQNVFIGSTSGALTYTALATTSSGGQWLAVSPASSQTPQSLTISVSPSLLQPGTYSGTVTVSAPGAANSPVAIPVTLTVSATNALTTSVEAIQMNYQIGGTNQVITQVVGVYSTGAPVDVTVTASANTCGGNWLRVYTPIVTTPGTATIAIDPALFTLPASCSGTITFASGSDALQIPVTMEVSTSPLFNFTPLSLTFNARFDGEPAPKQEIALSMTNGAAVDFSAAVSTTVIGANWLRVAPASGQTPAKLEVIADPLNLSVGTYTGSILLGSPALNGVQAIPVTLRVTSTVSATVNPTSLTFTQIAGGAAPPAQSVVLNTQGGATQFSTTVSTSNAVGWLSATPNVGSTPNNISVGVNGSNLQPGTYNGTVTLNVPAAANNPVIVPVTLTVLAARSIVTTTTSLTFAYRAGDAAPASQTVRVTSTGDPVNLGAATTGGSWLRVSPASAVTPGNFEVSVVPSGLSTGTYTGTVEITGSGGVAGSPIRIPVTLSVQSAPAPVLADLYNAASGLRSALAPGEIVTIKGSGLGPDTGVTLELTPEGKVATTLAGVRVLFNDTPGPILYASAAQINVVAPYEFAASSTVRVVIEYRGVRSPAFTYQVAPVAPGLFTASSTGTGQGAILNQNGSYNSETTPESKGNVVQIFGTGDGVSVPPLETGMVTPNLRRTAASVTALVGGFVADVTFAGPAPGAVAGLFQVNLRIPLQAPSGNVPVVILVGGVPTQSGVTVAVR